MNMPLLPPTPMLYGIKSWFRR